MSGGIAAALPEMLERLKLNAIRDRLDGLLDEATRRDLTLPETLVLLCGAEVAHREERRIQMGLGGAGQGSGRVAVGIPAEGSPSSPMCALWRASTSRPSPHSIPSRCATWPPAAGWPTATRC